MQIQKSLKDKTILLMEEDISLRKKITSILKSLFKEVYVAVDGYDALYKYELYLPDIVSTDLSISGLSGFDLIKEIRNKSSDTFVIIVSSCTNTDYLIDAIHNSVNRYIIKPITQDKYIEAFDAYLKKIEKNSNIIELSSSIRVELDKHLIIRDNQEIHINKKECLLLILLSKNENKTVSYEEIEERLWGTKPMSLSAIRTLVRDLRKKLGKGYVINISGIGYRLK